MGCIFAYMTQKDGSKKPTPPAATEETDNSGKEPLVNDASKKHRRKAKIIKMQMIQFGVAFVLLTTLILIMHYYF